MPGTVARYTALPDRAEIIVNGTDKFDFLQGLITQDITLLKTQDIIYSCLLTPNGKFLFDFFIRQDGDSLKIDCEAGERVSNLLKRLAMFKLRSDVTLDLIENIDVYQIFDAPSHDGVKDPRQTDNLYRCYSKPTSATPVNYEEWDNYRIIHEIPDGSRDLIPEKSFIHESDIIIKTAVSYTKGCYMGQELVSRMHHRGLIKKVLKCVPANAVPTDAEIRSQCGGVALALVKVA